MSGDRREEEQRQLAEEARSYRTHRKEAMREFTANVQKERRILDEAERTCGDELKAEIQKMRAALDEAERDFSEQADQALREFNKAVRQARRSVC